MRRWRAAEVADAISRALVHFGKSDVAECVLVLQRKLSELQGRLDSAIKQLDLQRGDLELKVLDAERGQLQAWEMLEAAEAAHEASEAALEEEVALLRHQLHNAQQAIRHAEQQKKATQNELNSMVDSIVGSTDHELISSIDLGLQNGYNTRGRG